MKRLQPSDQTPEHQTHQRPTPPPTSLLPPFPSILGLWRLAPPEPPRRPPSTTTWETFQFLSVPLRPSLCPAVSLIGYLFPSHAHSHTHDALLRFRDLSHSSAAPSRVPCMAVRRSSPLCCCRCVGGPGLDAPSCTLPCRSRGTHTYLYQICVNLFIFI